MKWKASYWWTVLLVVSVLASVFLLGMIAWPFDNGVWKKLQENWPQLIPSAILIVATAISIYFLRKNSQLIQKNTNVLSENTEALQQSSQTDAQTISPLKYSTVAGMVIAMLAVVAILLISSPEEDTRPTEEQVAQGVEDALNRTAASIEKLTLEEAQQTRHAQMQLAEEVGNTLSMTRQQVLEEVHQTRHVQTELIQETRNTLSEATVSMGKQILAEIQQIRREQEQLTREVEAARKGAEEAEQTLQKLESALSLLVIGDMAHMKAAIKDCHRQVRREMLAQSSVKPAFNSDDKLWIRASDWIKAAGMLNADEDYLSLSNPFSFRGSFKDRNGIKRNGHKYYETYRYECPFVPKAGIYGEISIEKQ